MPDKRRRRFDEDFKRRAVRLSCSSERTISEVAESLGVCDSVLHRWRKKYTPDGEKSQLSQKDEDISRLHSRIAELEAENDILKKASAYFAKNLKP